MNIMNEQQIKNFIATLPTNQQTELQTIEKDIITTAEVQSVNIISRLWLYIKNKFKGSVSMSIPVASTPESTAEIRTNAEMELLGIATNAILNHTAASDVKANTLQVILSAFMTYLSQK